MAFDDEIVQLRRLQIVHAHPLRAAVQMGDDGRVEQSLPPRHRRIEAEAVIIVEMNFVVVAPLQEAIDVIALGAARRSAQILFRSCAMSPRNRRGQRSRGVAAEVRSVLVRAA